ncbi:hypothetical protein E2C01_066929 [Portunus trituberculatus]|uniref:Uncharacterized protein n=1 Tax=Portunus trituberculatus TaxID=210409 RepID=A0A5B7HTP5_PORTR|nr:hypothetical protein [Portunus trituberculatus]
MAQSASLSQSQGRSNRGCDLSQQGSQGESAAGVVAQHTTVTQRSISNSSCLISPCYLPLSSLQISPVYLSPHRAAGMQGGRPGRWRQRPGLAALTNQDLLS